MSRLSTASHEAGHALVAVLLELEVRLVTILSDDPCRHSQAYVDLVDPDEDLEKAAMVRLAGRQALVAHGELNVPGAELGCRKDLEEARAFALVLAEGDEIRARVILDELRTRVDQFMLAHHLALGYLSIELLKNWTLTGPQVAATVGHWPHLAREWGRAGGGPSVCPPFTTGPAQHRSRDKGGLAPCPLLA